VKGGYLLHCLPSYFFILLIIIVIIIIIIIIIIVIIVSINSNKLFYDSCLHDHQFGVGLLDGRGLNILDKYTEKLQGTAFPICLYIDDTEPLNIKLSGKVCILAHSLIVNLLFKLG